MKSNLLIIFVIIYFIACNKNEQNKNDNYHDNKISSTSTDDSLKKKELELKEKELELKEKELKMQENNKSNSKLNNINITGLWKGTIKDGTKWDVYFTSQYLKEFDGYNTVYWNSHPNGYITQFAGTIDYDNNKIVMYEDRNAKGSGKFEGSISSEGNSMSGVWRRYSDNGSFSWNLKR